MKKIIFLFLFVFSLLTAQESLDELDLPSITIKGKVNAPKERLEFDENLSNTYETKKEFSFEPEISPFIFEEKKNSEFVAKKIFEMSIGYYYYINARAVYISQNPFLNFSFKTNNHFYDKNWRILSSNLFWSPKIYEKTFNLGFSSLNAKVNERTETNIFTASYFQNFDIENEYISSADLYLQTGSYRQKDEEIFDLDLIVSGKFEYGKIFITPEIVFLKQYFNFQVESYRYFDTEHLSKLSLHLFKTKERFIPSVGFRTALTLPFGLILSPKNQPHMKKSSRKTMMEENYVQKIDIPKTQTITPLNLQADIRYNENISLYNDFSYLMDNIIYNRTKTDSLYTQNFKNHFTNRMGIDIKYSYRALVIENRFYFEKSFIKEEDIFLPYTPEFYNILTFEYPYKNLSSKLQIETIFGRKDEFEEDVKNAFLVGITEKWTKSKNLSFELHLNNIFNRKYHKYTLYPSLGFEAFLGVSYMF